MKLSIYPVLRVLVIASGIYQLFFGEQVIGVFILATSALILTPALFTRNYLQKFPREIELMFFVMVFFQFVIGEARDFYTTVPYYDKFVHFLLPMFLGIISVTIFYTLDAMGMIRVSTGSMIVLVVLITLGIGAFWEIIEYTSDQLIAPRVENWHYFQGSLTEDPLHDTMNDLIVDLLGGIFGAIMAVFVFRRAKHSERMPVFLGEMQTNVKKMF